LKNTKLLRFKQYSFRTKVVIATTITGIALVSILGINNTNYNISTSSMHRHTQVLGSVTAQPAVVYKRQYGVTTVSSVNIRTGPGTNYSTQGSLNTGTNIDILGKAGNFYKISYNGKTAYIGAQYVKITVMTSYGKSVPVLAYHSITYEKGNSICLPIEKFKEQMQYLKDNGYHTITLTDLYKYHMRQRPIPEKSVVLTFDDGYENNYTAMFPVLKKYNFKATIFVITSTIDRYKKFLTSKQLIEMDKYSVDIESHTVNHDNLKLISKDDQLKTLAQSKKYLEKLLNKKINFIAYPYGGYSNSAIESVKRTGYTMAFTTVDSWSSKNDGLLSIHRVDISSSRNLKSFKTRISNPNYKSLAQ